MIRKKLFMSLVLCAFIITGLTTATQATKNSGMTPDDDITAITIGSKEAPNAGDTAAAKQAAITNGQHLAVAAAIEKILTSDILADNFDLLSALPYDRPERFINNYEVLAVAEGPHACRTLVRVTIGRESIEKAIKDAGILMDRRSQPIVLSLLKEQQPGKPILYWWQKGLNTTVPQTEQALANILTRKGIKTADHTGQSFPGEHGEGDGVAINGEIANATALSLAREYNADFVLIGGCVIGSLPEPSAEGHGQAIINLSARLLSVSTGERLLSVSESIKPDPAEAANAPNMFDAAGQRLAHKISPAIVNAWENRSDVLQTITITVTGLDYMSKLGTFRQSLAHIPKLKNVRTSEMTLQQAVLTVDFAGNAEHLATAIAASDRQSMKLIIDDVSQHSITIQLEPLNGSPASPRSGQR